MPMKWRAPTGDLPRHAPPRSSRYLSRPFPRDRARSGLTCSSLPLAPQGGAVGVLHHTHSCPFLLLVQTLGGLRNVFPWNSPETPDSLFSPSHTKVAVARPADSSRSFTGVPWGSGSYVSPVMGNISLQRSRVLYTGIVHMCPTLNATLCLSLRAVSLPLCHFCQSH